MNGCVSPLSFAALFLTLFTVAHRPVLASSNILDSEEQFLFAMDAPLLDKFFQVPINENQPISEYVERTLMKGTSLTTGKAGVAPYYSTNGIGVRILFNSSTNAETLNTNFPKLPLTSNEMGDAKVKVNFNWSILTHSTTAKYFLIHESGITTANAVSNSVSKITTSNINVQASGPLGGLIRGRAASKRAPQELARTNTEHETQAAQKISETLKTLVDEKTKEKMESIESLYDTYVYQPFITKALLGGRLAMGSNENWIAVAGIVGEKLKPLEVSDISLLKSMKPDKGSMVFRMDQRFVERLASLRMGGIQITEVEMAEIFGRTKPDEKGVDVNIVKANMEKELEMTFDEENPIEVFFKDDKIRLTLRLQELTTQGKTLKNVLITREIKILRDQDQISIESVSPEFPLHYDKKPVEPVLGNIIQKRIAEYLPEKPTLISDKILFQEPRTLKIKTLTANDGKLTVGLAP